MNQAQTPTFIQLLCYQIQSFNKKKKTMYISNIGYFSQSETLIGGELFEISKISS